MNQCRLGSSTLLLGITVKIKVIRCSSVKNAQDFYFWDFKGLGKMAFILSDREHLFFLAPDIFCFRRGFGKLEIQSLVLQVHPDSLYFIRVAVI